MDNRLQRTAIAFITNLTGATAAEIQEYAAEIRDNRKFYKGIEEKRNSYGRRESVWYYGLNRTLGTVLYIICRKQRPDYVLETGVASGVSSSYILGALEVNGRGQLYSIDLPVWQKIPSGWMIPDYLRNRWQLIQGMSSKKMAPLLGKIKEIDIFLHDSDHSYENMLWEFETVWTHLKTGGLLLAHNIDYCDAFTDFCRDHKVEGLTLGDMGGAIKR